MKNLLINDISVQVDPEKSEALKEDCFWTRESCECDRCDNAKMGRLDAMPQAHQEALTALGLDPLYPTHSAEASGPRPRSTQYAGRVSCWFAYGTIFGADLVCLPTIGDSKMWIESNRHRLNSQIEGLDRINPTEGEGIIYIVASAKIPWLYGEVCSFRQEFSANDCPRCGSRWRKTGYLKKNSLIPEWKGEPHLNQILRLRRQRVHVEFCSRCGRMDYKLVEDKRPFRMKNRIYRNEKRNPLQRLRSLNRGTMIDGKLYFFQ